MKIPRCMSTQHPDNVNIPFFAENGELGGEDEIQEAYYVFSHLGCDEQMWDSEGKEVDNYIVKKLLSKYGSFFKTKILGESIFITMRVPNPEIEKSEAKILLETLESIPRSFDIARIFYNADIPPIFEVIVPMVTSSESIDLVYRYYVDFVVGKKNMKLKNITVSQWIGDFKPERINVIPLFEDRKNMLNAHNHMREYLKDKDISYQRVFLARSDPALNYGLVSAVLLNKISIKRLYKLEEEMGVRIYPIIGTGPSPFRGNLNPENIENVLKEYPGVYTFTIQSAFKYDHPPEKVIEGIRKIKESKVEKPEEIDEKKSLELIDRYSNRYRERVLGLKDAILSVSRFIPSRRKRKLHIGLFGYSRNVGGVSLPRAIRFTASLYSLGIPPEILGITALSKSDLDFLREAYINFEKDLKDALRFYNPQSRLLNKEVKKSVEKLGIDFDIDLNHKEITKEIEDLILQNKINQIGELVLRAASLRKFLG